MMRGGDSTAMEQFTALLMPHSSSLGGLPFWDLGKQSETPSIVKLSSRELPGKRQAVVRA